MTVIRTYYGAHDQEIIDLILSIQNGENHLGIPLSEQMDLTTIKESYQDTGGEFWLALDGEHVVGTIALMKKSETCGVLKKFFVKKEYRKQGVGGQLYEQLLRFARENRLQQIILDTPAVAVASHRFYERVGFRKISRAELPIEYSYPDRNSYLYLLEL